MKFTPLATDRIAAAVADFDVSNPAEFLQISAAVARLYREGKYVDLIDGCRAAAISADFIQKNINEIARFLRDCRLIGHVGEEDAVGAGSYVIGASGVALIQSYLKTKAINRGAHEVEVIKNQTIETATGSRAHADIFLEQKGVIDALNLKVQEDLKANVATDFNKTYLVEVFGTTGGNHFVALTARKAAGEIAPIFELFDPSPGLVRGGLEGHQNAIANGWCAQIQINATLTAAFDKMRDDGFPFEFCQKNFFHNVEPMQAGGGSNCSIFAYEKAWITARMSREEHEKILRHHYQSPSPYGGMAEVVIDLKKVRDEGNFVVDPALNMPWQYMAFSHFLSSSIDKIERPEFESKPAHARKSGEVETLRDRLERYSETGKNLLIEQKAIRQKYGHLLEMVTDSSFIERAAGRAVPDPVIVEKAQSPYFPFDFAKAESEGVDQFVKAVNEILPFPEKVNSYRVGEAEDGKKFCEMDFYIGELSGEKFAKWAGSAGLVCAAKREGFGFKLTGAIDETLQGRMKVTLFVPLQEETLKMIQATDTKTIFPPITHAFSPPSASARVRRGAERGVARVVEGDGRDGAAV